MIGALIGAGLSAIGSIAGGLKQRALAKKQQENLKERAQDNLDWYNRNYNADATQRADAQRILQLTENAIKRRNRAAAGTAAVMGGMSEAVAADKEAGNRALADAASQIAASAESRKDAIEQQYLQRKDAIEDAKNNLAIQQANNISQAIQGVTGAAGDIASNLDGYYDKGSKSLAYNKKEK